MADQDKRQRDDDALSDSERDKLKGDPHEENNEWLRDQVGEDHNLSGSSTYRTLPDQPNENQSEQDTKKRQSNR